MWMNASAPEFFSAAFKPDEQQIMLVDVFVILSNINDLTPKEKVVHV
jgi:hypothetical protein